MGGFAAWLLGLAAEQPVEYRRLLRIRRHIYTPIAQLDAQILPSAEPIPFEQIDLGAFQPLRPARPGARSSTVRGCASGNGAARAAANRSRRGVVMLGIRGEGLDLCGRRRRARLGEHGWIQGDLPHAGGKYRQVLARLISRRAGSSSMRMSHTTAGCSTNRQAVFHGAHIATTDDEAFGLYYDYLTLAVLAGATEDAALEAELRRALSTAYARFRAGDIRGARDVLAAQLSPPIRERLRLQRHRPRPPRHGVAMAAARDRRKAARTYARALNSDRAPRRLHLRHEPAAADAVDEVTSSPLCSSG